MSGYDVRSLLRPADVLLIVPPFTLQDRPALGLHLLQAVARQAGLEAQVLYTNILFAAWFGERTHTTVTKLQYGLFLGERIFVRSAFGGPPLGRDGGQGLVAKLEALRAVYRRSGVELSLGLEQILAHEAQIPAWLASFTPALAAGYAVAGSTSSFEQTSAAIAILSSIKRATPATITIMGGANCEGEMAAGICSLTDQVDFVFSGESEATFLDFLTNLQRGAIGRERIISGQPRDDMDGLPTPDYSDYYTQLQAWTPDCSFLTEGQVHLTYETSRGCWWGERSHCTFCGLNGQGMSARAKSPDRVISELEHLLATHPTKLVAMTDNIMPHEYFRTLLPRLAGGEVPGARIMYEQKANLSLENMRDLVRAGVEEIQPGIEALSTGLLKLMAKGTTATKNITLLRYAQSFAMKLHWNLLVGFPHDELAFYEETLELVPLLCHLQPPQPPCPMIIDRFSPYFEHPERYGVSDLRPFWFYENVLPESAELDKLAYHFEGTFDSAALDHPTLRALGEQVFTWRKCFYSDNRPQLSVARGSGSFVLRDTRGLPGVPEEQIIDESQAGMALVSCLTRSRPRASYAWALEHRLVVERDGRYVALAVADPDLLFELEQRQALHPRG